MEFVFGQDNFPLMAPFDIDSVSIDLPEWATPSSNPSPEPQPETTEPFPTWIVAAIAIIATGVAITLGVVTYRRKRSAFSNHHNS